VTKSSRQADHQVLQQCTTDSTLIIHDLNFADYTRTYVHDCMGWPWEYEYY